MTVAFFVVAEAPAPAGVVSGKAPGLVLFAGLLLACLRFPGASAVVAAGSLDGLTTFVLTLARSRVRLPVATLPAGCRRSRLSR